jgi:phosphoribosylcarboxyaminoimidazole (NCAIR) mutase
MGAKVAIVMGSQSDWETMTCAVEVLDELVQMPAGVPVGTLAIGKAGATNAGLLAAAILANHDIAVSQRLQDWRAARSAAVTERPVG